MVAQSCCTAIRVRNQEHRPVQCWPARAAGTPAAMVGVVGRMRFVRFRDNAYSTALELRPVIDVEVVVVMAGVAAIVTA